MKTLIYFHFQFNFDIMCGSFVTKMGCEHFLGMVSNRTNPYATKTQSARLSSQSNGCRSELQGFHERQSQAWLFLSKNIYSLHRELEMRILLWTSSPGCLRPKVSVQFSPVRLPSFLSVTFS